MSASPKINYLKMDNVDYDKYMVNEYPMLFLERNSNASPMSRGFTIGNGWYELVDDLCYVINFICRTMGFAIVVRQVKEKMGALRFYISIPVCKNNTIISETDIVIWRNIIYNIIWMAEDRSNKTCMICSKKYKKKIKVNGYIHAVCEECFNGGTYEK